MADVHLTLLGLDRIGLSLGLAIKQYQAKGDAVHTFTITGCGDACKEAKKQGAVDHCARSPEAACENADIVLVDASLSVLREQMEKIGPVLKGGCVVIETAPLKQPAIRWAQRYLPENVHLVGVTFVLGPDSLYAVPDDSDYAHAGLFERGSLCVAAAPDCAPEAVQLATDMGDLIGLEAHYMGPAEHDGLMASAHDLPVLLALALFDTVSASQSWPDIRRLTNAPFAFSSAPLSESPQAIFDLMVENRENIRHQLDKTIEQLGALRDALAQPEGEASLAEWINKTADAYREWEYQRYTGQWPDRAKPEPPDISPGGLLGLGALFGRRRGDEKEK